MDVKSTPAAETRSGRSAGNPEAPKGFADVARRRRWALALSAGLATLSTAFGLAPYLLVYLISLHLFGQPLAEADASYVWLLAGLSVVAVFAKALTFGLADRVSHIAAYDILYELRMELAGKLGTLPLGYFSERTTGEIKKVVHEDVEQIEEGIAHAIPDVTSAVTTPVLTAVVLFFVDWRMGLATVALMPFLVLAYGLCMSRSKEYMLAYQGAMARLNAVVVQYVQGMRVIKAFTRTDSSFREYKQAVDEATDIYERAQRVALPPYAVFLAGLRANVVVRVRPRPRRRPAGRTGA